MNSKVFKTGLDPTVAGAIHLEEGQGMDKNIALGQGMIPNYRGNYRNGMRGNQRYGRQNYNGEGLRRNLEIKAIREG